MPPRRRRGNQGVVPPHVHHRGVRRRNRRVAKHEPEARHVVEVIARTKRRRGAVHVPEATREGGVVIPPPKRDRPAEARQRGVRRWQRRGAEHEPKARHAVKVVAMGKAMRLGAVHVPESRLEADVVGGACGRPGAHETQPGRPRRISPARDAGAHEIQPGLLGKTVSRNRMVHDVHLAHGRRGNITVGPRRARERRMAHGRY